MDVEMNAPNSFSWQDLVLNSPNRAHTILSSQSGSVQSGQLLAVMGPSGAGKSSLLDVLSRRVAPSNPGVASISFNGDTSFDMRSIGSYVEQDDALLGVLTVRETITYAARLSLAHDVPGTVIEQLVHSTMDSLGLSDVANSRIGTPVQRGISGGQKRRVTIACSVVSRPKILLCDEPTSGLDSLTSYQVISSIKRLARETNTIVIATIHQPNWETFSLFDNVLFLSLGKTIYHGPVHALVSYFSELGYTCPPHSNPADFVISLTNTDFHTTSPARSQGEKVLDSFTQQWSCRSVAFKERQKRTHNPRYGPASNTKESIATIAGSESQALIQYSSRERPSFLDQVGRTRLLTHRAALNYRRNILAYGIRIAMYAGMGLLLATIWIQLAQDDSKVNDRLSVHFFSVAFLGFMSVAGIPSFLEERAVFVRERANGLYGPGAYVIANSLVTLPFLFVCSLLFSVICYWAIGLHEGATHFFRFLAFLFLAVYIAEAQSILIASLIPIFVAALAIAAFMNGFWMCVQGYFIRAVNLPRFWYYWAHFLDYQTYAFNLLVRNDFAGLTFSCATLANGDCSCSLPSSLISQGQCALTGEDVLDSLGLQTFSVPLYAGILLIIAVVYRVLFYIVLVFKKK